MKIAVCIPTYNKSIYIAESIRSVVNQAQAGLEIHVFDNASEDNTAEICYSFRDKIHYHKNEMNLGYVGNINECLKLHKTYDWIGILHSDDRHSIESINYMKVLITKYPEIGIVFSETDIMDSNGIIIHKGTCKERLYRMGSEAIERCQLQLPCSTCFYRSEAIANGGYFDIAFPYSADEEYNARIASKYAILESGRSLAAYRIHPENTMLKTWSRPDFIQNFEDMRVRMAEYGGLSHDVAATKVRFHLGSALLGCGSELACHGDPVSAMRFYNYGWSNNPRAFLQPLQIIKYLLVVTPIVGIPLLRAILNLKKSLSRVLSKYR